MFSNWLDRFRPKVLDEVTKARVHAIMHAEVERLLEPKGFETVDELKWVRGQDAPIRQVFQFSKWKDGKVRPLWGVSLDFIPHISGKKAAWHRSNKSAKLDLCCDPGTEKLKMFYLYGDKPIQRQYKYVVSAALKDADRFWEMSRSVGDLPKAIDWLQDFYQTDRRPTFYSYSQHVLAVPFVLKHLGKEGEALAEFERRRALMWAELDAKQKIGELLAE
jgi:hypothetical protein